MRGEELRDEGLGKGRGKGNGPIRLSQIINKNSSTLAKRQYSIFMQRSIRRQDTLSEPLDHGTREGEVLFLNQNQRKELAQLNTVFIFHFAAHWVGYKDWGSGEWAVGMRRVKIARD